MSRRNKLDALGRMTEGKPSPTAGLEALLESDWNAGLAKLQNKHDPRLWAIAIRFAPTPEQQATSLERAVRLCRAIADPAKRVTALSLVASGLTLGGKPASLSAVLDELDAAIAALPPEADVPGAIEEILGWAIDADTDLARRYGVRLAKLATDDAHWRVEHILTHVIDHLARAQPDTLDPVVQAIPSGKTLAWALGRAQRAKMRPK